MDGRSIKRRRQRQAPVRDANSATSNGCAKAIKRAVIKITFCRCRDRASIMLYCIGADGPGGVYVPKPHLAPPAARVFTPPI